MIKSHSTQVRLRHNIIKMETKDENSNKMDDVEKTEPLNIRLVSEEEITRITDEDIASFAADMDDEADNVVQEILNLTNEISTSSNNNINSGTIKIFI